MAVDVPAGVGVPANMQMALRANIKKTKTGDRGAHLL
jgi:hypothetical protein